ncbi:MAG: ABC transporter permease [Gemmatimonadetes bacterium]|nr:ABC transporter permease [Gemmatimonadota bacterium]MBI3567883.1 ABC transporter permease [Gemmatimonadota bacterium]
MSAATRRIRALAREAFPDWPSRVAIAVLALVLLAVLFAPLLAPYDPNALADFVRDQFLAPSMHHPFGTDQAGRDVLSRVMHGGRVSLGVAALSVVVSVAVGALWGAVAGFAGGVFDATLMRVSDAVLAFPRILLLLLMTSLVRAPSAAGIALLLGITSWPGMSRLVRAEVRHLREQDYVLAARALGVPWWRTLRTHLLPGVAPQVSVAAALAFASVIPLEATLSFLGLGLHPPAASWGNILLDGADQAAAHWWLVLFPALAIVVTVVCVNTIGERLQDAIDPRRVAP